MRSISPSINLVIWEKGKPFLTYCKHHTKPTVTYGSQCKHQTTSYNNMSVPNTKLQATVRCGRCAVPGTLRDQWQQYEAFYEELSQWIKDTESEMKSDSELKATLEQKTIQLEKQKVRKWHASDVITITARTKDEGIFLDDKIALNFSSF